MSLILSVPGKTFIAGEYLALKAGPALVFSSQPRFALHVKKGQGALEGIHPDSPAGLLVKAYQNYFAEFDLKFVDPSQGQGGFGASTAQFLAVYAMHEWKDSVLHEPQKLLDVKHLLEIYQKFAWMGQGLPPSGADLVGQVKGGLTLFDRGMGKVSTLSWTLSDLDMVFVHTGNKLATHEHLKGLGDFSDQSLREAFAKIHTGLIEGQAENFVSGINSYAQALADLGLTCEPTSRILEGVRKVPGVQAAKGCGALGADVVLIVFNRHEGDSLEKYLVSQNLAVTTRRSQISEGLEVHLSGSVV